MENKTIKIKVYRYHELSEHVKKLVRMRFLMFFKEHVNKDTLFLRDGTLFNEDGLSFKGLKDFEVL